MSELQRYSNFILTYSSTTQTFSVGSTGRAYVFTEGATVNQNGSLSGALNTTLTVFDSGSFAANDWMQIGLSGPPRQVKSVDSQTQLTLFDGSVQTIAIGDRALNIGTASDKSVSHAVIYSYDQTSAGALSPSRVTADDNGNFEFFADTGDYDVLMQNSSGVDLAIDADVTLFAINRSDSAGIGGTGVTYLQSVNDDFAVGFVDTSDFSFYFDTSAKIAYFGSQFDNRVEIADGASPYVRLVRASGQPSVVFDGNSFHTTLISSQTSDITITLPNIAGTLLVGATQTIAGTQTFSGAIIGQSTLAITGTSTLTGALTAPGGAIIGNNTTKAYTDNYRISSTKGTTVSSPKVVATGSAFGTSPSTAIASNSKDQRMTFTITVGSSPSTTSGTITITYEDGVWPIAPFVHAILTGKGGGATATITEIDVSTTTAAATLTITFSGAPSVNHTFTFTVFTWG